MGRQLIVAQLCLLTFAVAMRAQTPQWGLARSKTLIVSTALPKRNLNEGHGGLDALSLAAYGLIALEIMGVIEMPPPPPPPPPPQWPMTPSITGFASRMVKAMGAAAEADVKQAQLEAVVARAEAELSALEAAAAEEQVGAATAAAGHMAAMAAEQARTAARTAARTEVAGASSSTTFPAAAVAVL